MPMHNLIEYSGNYSERSRSLYQFCRDEPNDDITESESFKFKSKFLWNTKNEGIIDAKIPVPLNYLVVFGKLLKYSQLIVKLILFLLGQ